MARGVQLPDGLVGPLRAQPGGPVRSPHAGRGLHYVSAVALPDGGLRLYYEVTRPDGAHELRTEVRHRHPPG